MGQQTKAGYGVGSKGLEAILNPVKHSYVYDPLNLFGNNPNVKAQQAKEEADKEALRSEWEKTKKKRDELKNQSITFNEDEIQGDL